METNTRGRTKASSSSSSLHLLEQQQLLNVWGLNYTVQCYSSGSRPSCGRMGSSKACTCLLCPLLQLLQHCCRHLLLLQA
jgi:hypothetical protein